MLRCTIRISNHALTHHQYNSYQHNQATSSDVATPRQTSLSKYIIPPPFHNIPTILHRPSTSVPFHTTNSFRRPDTILKYPSIHHSEPKPCRPELTDTSYLNQFYHFLHDWEHWQMNNVKPCGQLTLLMESTIEIRYGDLSEPKQLSDTIQTAIEKAITLDGRYEMAKLSSCQFESYPSVTKWISAQDMIIEHLAICDITIEDSWREFYIMSTSRIPKNGKHLHPHSSSLRRRTQWRVSSPISWPSKAESGGPDSLLQMQHYLYRKQVEDDT